MTEENIELSTFFEESDWTPTSYQDWSDRIHTSREERERFDDLLKQAREQSGPPLAIAIGLAMTGHYCDALAAFGAAGQSKAADYFAGKTASSIGKFDQAMTHFAQAADQGWDRFEIDMECAIVHVQSDDRPAARTLVDKHASAGDDRAVWHLVDGMIREYEGEYVDALECYERSLALDPDDPRTMFRCAFLYDLHGDDAKGIELYERLAIQPAAHVNALMNLVVLYEDQGKYEEAAECLQRILAANPNHVRARLFFKDVESGRTMHIDEAQIERVDTETRQLETPISEFELSVRARNCLKKMNIHTLGDLLRTSETELLAYKNFGETSLTEIKELLTKCEFDLGQPLEPAAPDPVPAPDPAPAPAPVAPPTPPPIDLPPGTRAALSKPVSQLELSVRARKCLQRLNISTIGALISRTETDLMAIRNFGMTSLVEIKSRLSDIGLTLAGSPDSGESASSLTP